MAPHAVRWKRLALVVGLIALCAFSVVVRIPFLRVPMITDEGGAAYVARYWTSDYQPYKDMNYDRLQGFFLIYKAIFALLGHRIVSIRLAAALYNIGTLVAVFVFARALIPGSTGWIAGAFFALFSAAPAIEGFTANSEIFAVFPLALSAYFVWREKWFFAGLLSGMAVLFKPIGISGFLLGAFWILANRRKLRSALLPMSLGFAVGPALAAFHGWLVGWEYFWSTFVKHRALAFSVFSNQPGSQLRNFLLSQQATSPAWIGLAVLTVIALLYSDFRIRLFGLAWLGSTLVGMALGGNWFEHYYVQAIPPLAVLAGVGTILFLQRKMKSWAVWGCLTLVGLGSFFAFQAKYWFMPPDPVSLGVYNRPAYLVSEQVGEYIANHTRKDDLIYVAFGQAEIYYYAQRKAAVPQQLYWHQIAANKDLWNAVVDSIRAKRPAMIAWVQYQPPENWSTPEAFEALLDQGYVLDKELPPIRLYRRRSAGESALAVRPGVVRIGGP